MSLDRKFCLPGYPRRRHPEDVLEVITFAQKTSIFWRLFGQMEIYEKERHAWSAPKKKLMGRLVKLVELVKKCWKVISSRVRRHALRHFWKSTKNWKEAMTWRQVDNWTTQQVEKNTNRQSWLVHLLEDEKQQWKETFLAGSDWDKSAHTEEKHHEDRQRQSHVSERGHENNSHDKKEG